ncbi:MAG: RecBCD enzyme subunit RecB [Pseudomonadota bacterium]
MSDIPPGKPEHRLQEMQELDPQTLPLRGAQVIEASAGTGKTWTLAALYVRLVLGHGRDDTGLLPPDILVMTFTEAATAELRERIRDRLAQAARHFRAQETGDAFLQALRASYAPERWPACAWRLDLAAQWMDDAAIFTIHGWSSRMLRQHALGSASLFEQSKVEDSEGLRLAAVRDYWRRWFYALPEEQLAALDKLAQDPQQLLERLKPRWQAIERSPEARYQDTPQPPELLAAWSRWQAEVDALEQDARAAWARHTEALRTQLVKAMDYDLSGTTYRAASREGYLAQLDAWATGGPRDAKNIGRFGIATLRAKTKTSKPKSGMPPYQTPVDEFGVYARLQELSDLLATEPDIQAGLVEHAAQAVALAYESRKRELAQFDFSDLLQRLYHALHSGDGRLAQAIRQQYPVALVDEFQDTDPWQYGALERIYLDGLADEAEPAPEPEGGDQALLMIGDPKQAIYSFRGADLATYLRARDRAEAVHTLSGNRRSTRQLVEAVNHVFAQAEQPFGALPFVPVQARNEQVQPLRRPDGSAHAALTVWHLASERPLGATAYQQAMAECCAGEMVRLLNQGLALPGQMAVLVRGWQEARAIRTALAGRGVRSVYLSERDSVWRSAEALDLWYLLRAVAQPRSVSCLRAALSCRTLGKSLGELDRLIRDEAAWDEQVEHFSRWHQTWQRQGFLAMLYQLLHEQQVPQRLLATTSDAERRLTNLLHLGDLLQRASLELQGEGALVRFLGDQLHEDAVSSDAAQMRLESDADLVQVVTMHKSKGLQYPLVFLPFVANFRAESAGSGRDDGERLAEDIRLLYVALTRAERALWLGVADRARDFNAKGGPPRSALSRLLGRRAADDLAQRLQCWAACPEVAVLPAPEAGTERYLPAAVDPGAQAAREPRRALRGDWWMASFSALTRELEPAALPQAASVEEERYLDAQTDSREPVLPGVPDLAPGTPEAVAVTVAVEPRYNAFGAGSAYGTLLHDLLEWQLREGWPLLRADAPAGQLQRWQQQLAARADALQLDAAMRELLPPWLAQIADTALPLGEEGAGTLRLADLSLQTAWPEMSFTVLTHGVTAQRIDRLITTRIQPGQPRNALRPSELQGLLIGFMDLVFEHEGRYYVLDYKSNKLPGYGPAELEAAMLAHRYEVQAMLYLLALHRLLKARLPDYDYDRHVGGALYLFLRGIDQPGAGLHRLQAPRALIEALDQAFAEGRPLQFHGEAA